MYKRLTKELNHLSSNPPDGISCYIKNEENTNILSVSINGPRGSPYEGGIFHLEVEVTNKYPLEPPRIQFLNKVYHPNIDDNGLICMDLLKMPPHGNWKPTIQLEHLFVAIQALLSNPNPDDPLMPEIASEYKFNNEEFIRKAKQCTLMAAKKGN